MSLPTYRRHHGYQPGRQPPYSTQPWPIMLWDITYGMAAWFDAAVLARDGADDFIYLLAAFTLPSGYRWYVEKRRWADDDPDPDHRAGELLVRSSPLPLYAAPNDRGHPCIDTDGADIYVARALHPSEGWVPDDITWERRSTGDLSILQSWDCSAIINNFATTSWGYPVEGQRVDWLHGARLAPTSGHVYFSRAYQFYPGDYGWDLIDYDLAAGTYRVLVNLAPGAGGPTYPRWTPFQERHVPLAVADDGDSIWISQRYLYNGGSQSAYAVWRSQDGGQTFSAPQLLDDVLAPTMWQPVLWDASSADGQPVLLSLTVIPCGDTGSGFRLRAWDLRRADDPLPAYWFREPADPGADQDMCGWVRVVINSIRSSYHSSLSQQRIFCTSSWARWHPMSPWDYYGGGWLAGDYCSLWLFRPIVSVRDLNFIQDRADLMHIHVVGDDGLRQYRDLISAVADATPAVLGDYGVPGCVREPNGDLRLLAADGPDMAELASDDDGAIWTSGTPIAALAGATRPTIHPLAGTALPQPPGGAGAKPASYLLSAWKADDILIYRAHDAHTWDQISTLAEDVPEQQNDALIWSDGALRIYYTSRDSNVYARLSTDEGNAWGDPVLAISGCTHPAALILPHGEVLIACWQTDQLMLGRSDDGESFGDPLNIREAGGAAVPEHGEPHKCGLARAADGKIYLFFFDGGDLKAVTSDDSGHTWS